MQDEGGQHARRSGSSLVVHLQADKRARRLSAEPLARMGPNGIELSIWP